ncbi:MAG: hypothetical protein AAGJ86_01740, partial [Pseudomonadota bacterium]
RVSSERCWVASREDSDVSGVSRMIFGTAAVLVTAAGVALIRLLWGRQSSGKALGLAVGWCLVVAAGFFWIQQAGVEYGAVFALSVVSVLAWLAVLTNTRYRQPHTRSPARVSVIWPTPGKSVQQLMWFVIVVGLCFAVSMIVLLGAVRWLPATAVTHMAALMIGLPVVWGCLAYTVLLTRRIGRSMLALAGLCAVGVALMALG